MKNAIQIIFFWKFVFSISAEISEGTAVVPLHLESDCLINIVSANNRPPKPALSQDKNYIHTPILKQIILT